MAGVQPLARGPAAGRPPVRGDRCQQRHRARDRQGARGRRCPGRARACATSTRARPPPTRCPATSRSRCLDVADLSSVRAFADDVGAGGRPHQQRRRPRPPVRAVTGRGRAAPRHQPPRALRAHQPAAAAAHRPGRGRRLRLAPLRRARPRRPAVGAPPLRRRSRRTAPPSSPTCCSSPSCSAGSPPPGSTLRVTGAHPGTTVDADHVRLGEPGQAAGRQVRAPADRHAGLAGRAAHPVRRHDGRAGQHLPRAAPAARDDRLADPGRAAATGPSTRTSAKALWTESERLSGVTFPL